MTRHHTETTLGALVAKVGLLFLVIGATGALVGTIFVPTAMAVTGLVETVDADVFDVPPLPDTELPPENSFIYAADGSLIAEINFEENRIPVELDEVPQVTVDAVIATEDARFYEHNGVNHRAILRAAVANARAGSVEQGGSTITQQYVKNAFLTTDQTLNRKIKEAIYAVELEKRLSKDEILERYLNRSYFGAGVYGIGTAARRYFDQPVQELTLAESAMLAGLIRFPEGNNPFKDPQAASQRRNIVLDQMARHGYITAEQAERAQAEELGIAPTEPEPPAFPFWVDWVTRLLINEETAEGLGSQVEALRAMGDEQADRIAQVFQGGLHIHTTLDPELQELGEAALREHLGFEGETPEEIAQEPLGGLISVEPGTGAVRTMAIGPRAYGACDQPIGLDDAGRQLCDKTKFNPLVPADAGSSRVGRQPGSSFKPFLIAAALEKGIPPGWQVDATGPATIPGCDNGEDWEVDNSGGNGLQDMYTGVKASSNVFHAKLIKEVGPANVADMAQRLGIRQSRLPEECSLALGAVDVFPLEMATAFATLANRGEYCAAYAIERVEDPDGQVLYEHTPTCEQVVDTAVADRVVDIMRGPVTAGGTAPVANLGRWPTRGKTGTTNDFRDAWFVGYVKQLATAAWIGYDNGIVTYDCDANPQRCEQPDRDCFAVAPESNTRDCVETRLLRNVTVAGRTYARIFGGTISAPMWKTYMAAAVERFDPVSFPRPSALPGAMVPDLLAVDTLAAAEELAEEAKLNLIVEEVDHWEPEGSFVAQTPEAGEQVTAGSAVVLEVSNGTAEPPVVPFLLGMAEDKAIALLQELGYDVAIVEVGTSKPKEDGKVVDQSPEPGTDQPPGEDVTVVIQVARLDKGGPEPSPTPDPSPSPSPSPDDPEPEPDPEPDGRPGGGNGGGNGNGGGGGGD